MPSIHLVLGLLLAAANGETLHSTMMRTDHSKAETQHSLNSTFIDTKGHIQRVRKTPGHSPQAKLGVVYSIMANNGKSSRDNVRAQLATWAAEASKQDRYIAVTGERYGEAEKAIPGALSEAACSDDYFGIPCKEVHALEVGAARDPDWLVRVDDDVFVDVNSLETALASFSTEEMRGPVALGMYLGCGKNSSQVNLIEYCPFVADQGAICGGGGYALNRAALALLKGDGWPQLLQEYQAYQRAGFFYGDMVTTCALSHRGVHIRDFDTDKKSYYEWLDMHKKKKDLHSLVVRMMKQDTWKNYSSMNLWTYHYATPKIMHWLDAKVRGMGKETVSTLEANAFEEGCCCWRQPEEKKWCQSGNWTDIPPPPPHKESPFAWAATWANETGVSALGENLWQQVLASIPAGLTSAMT